MKKVLISISQILVLAIIHSWILITFIRFTDMISMAMEESVKIRGIYGNPVVEVILMYFLLPVLAGAVIGLVFWLIYRKTGVSTVTLYLMTGYLILSFISSLISNIDYNEADWIERVCLVTVNYILTSTVFVCCILPMTKYGDRFIGFVHRMFKEDNRK